MRKRAEGVGDSGEFHLRSKYESKNECPTKLNMHFRQMNKRLKVVMKFLKYYFFNYFQKYLINYRRLLTFPLLF